jgi:Family of unknown function (DUF6529)
MRRATAARPGGLRPVAAACAREVTRRGNYAISTPGTRRGPSSAVHLAVIGLLAAAVTGALYALGRLGAPDHTVSVFGQAWVAANTLKLLLTTFVLGLAVVQMLLARWPYRKVLPVSTRRLPGSDLPAAGGVLALLVAVLWYTSAQWHNGYQLPGV